MATRVIQRVGAAVPTFLDGTERPACRNPDFDPEWWFPTPGAPALGGVLGAAIAICHRCPLREACGEWAVRTGQPAGVWGGLLPSEIAARHRCEAGTCLHAHHWRTTS